MGKKIKIKGRQWQKKFSLKMNYKRIDKKDNKMEEEEKKIGKDLPIKAYEKNWGSKTELRKKKKQLS